MKLKRYLSPSMPALFPVVVDRMTNSGKSTAWSECAPDPKPFSLDKSPSFRLQKKHGSRSASQQEPGRTGFPSVFHHQVGSPHSPLLQGVDCIKAGGNGQNRVLQMRLKMCCVSALKNNVMNSCFLLQLENGRYFERQATSVCSQCKKLG